MTSGVALPAAARRLIDTPEFAVLATADPGGGLHQCVMWVGRTGDELYMVTKSFRRQCRNLLADPRVGVLVYSRDRPRHYVRVEGTATVSEDGATALAHRLARAYTGRDHEVTDPAEEAQRVVVRIRPERVHVYGEAA
ncbi:TIGR03618 family F420-dependent PPOX class oxidoreductase [Actinoallomurus purpureus]|uniref:pyridoxamine 5'-phosphate oxidase family protein n=1 Tax=Actinoallomurus purpureus TaxID=478114 RepID=UPI002092A5A8|nr:TIGR03618 family F420-dependent PPOX class oxidoreductase [Actinoallomurus purpureus]MCO6006884.1 TIGR03618 family F420-dependent PPOX class oxidoreductase [Actinoallomurus purpureus]